MTGVVLAAGGSRRMGQPKLLLNYQGRPLLAWTLGLVERLPLPRRLLVVGAQQQRVRAALSLDGWELVVNDDWQEGMASSLRAAAEAAGGGLLVFLGDMPCVSEAAARAVLEQAGPHPVAPAFAGRRGFPVYLPPQLRPQLLALRGDVGARGLLQGCRVLPWPDPGVVWDVDTKEDLACGRPDRWTS
ncbi:MAG: nucleotidyltransferase family protein [Candidatus Bipolaricaulaceae bacterium]